MTILYLSDWDKYPEAIADLSTKNETFLRYSSLLKSMGVANHLFPLQLHDTSLIGVDPHDPNISMENMQRVALECKTNYFYFFREVARVPGSSADDVLMFKANRGNMALYWLFFNHVTVILIQIRQTGKSFSVDTLVELLCNIACSYSEINLLTKDDGLRTSNLERLRAIESELPFYLKLRTRADLFNSEEFSIKALNNRYRGHLPQKSISAALKVGRGLTGEIFLIDEAAFLSNIAVSLPAALAAGTAARDKARRNDTPWGTIFTTTAGKKDDVDGAYMYDMLVHSAVWSEKFFDCKDIAQLEDVIRKASPKGELRVNCSFNHRQLGYTDEWLKRAVEEAQATGEAAERDFGNKWTSGSQMSPLPIALTEVINRSIVGDNYTEIAKNNNYIIRWYVDEDKLSSVMNSNSHIISVDSSDAAGGDDIGMIITNVRTGGVTGAGNYNETNLISFADWLCELLVTYPKTTLIIERRSTGAMILDYLLLMLPSKGIDPFTRIYNKAVQDCDEQPERYKEISKPVYARDRNINVTYKKLFGFATSAGGATSRTELYSTTLLSAAKTAGDKVHDQVTARQILALVIKNGRVDHPPGGNDDMCISWLLGHWLLTKGTNLHHYGIDTREIFADNRVKQIENDPVSVYDRQEQDNIRSEIEHIVESLKRSRDPVVCSKLESKLTYLASMLEESDRQYLSLDDLLVNLKEYRRLNVNARY